MKTQAEELHAAIQNIKPEGFEGEAMLNKFVLIAEWIDVEEGKRWLSRIEAPNSTGWDTQGMLHNALYEDWSGE